MRYINKDFYIFQLASFLNTFGLRMFQLALAWWALDQTGSISLFSYIVAFGAFFEVFVNLAFGWLGDYKKRKNIYLAGLLLSCIANFGFLVFYYLGDFSFLYVLLISGVMGIANGIRMPIEGSIIPELVKESDISEAITQKSTFFSVANIAGPVMAGILLEVTTIGFVLILTGILLLLSMISVRLVSRYKSKSVEINADIDSFFYKSISGIRTLYHTRTELYMALLSVIINFTIYPLFFLLIPAFVKITLDSEAWNVGLIEFGFAFGVLLGSSLIVKIFNKTIGRYMTLLVGVMFLGVCMFGFVIIDQPIILVFTMVVGGIGLMLYNINAAVVRTIATPDSHQSRMFSSVIFLSSVANPLGVLFCGILISNIGIINTFLSFSLLIFICVPLVVLIPKYRQIMGMSDGELTDIYKNLYPHAFLNANK